MRDDDAVRVELRPATEGGGSPPPGSAGTPPPRRERRRLKPYFSLAFGLLVLLVAWLAFTAPLNQSLQPIAAPSITLLSAEGVPIARRGATIEAPVSVAKLPRHVPHAFIAIEDRRFYRHIGIDPWGMLRAAIHNMRSKGIAEGGSTITQQLAKLSFLSPKRTIGRKLQEVLIALWLETWLSKDEILSRYLSNVYFGDNVYGLRAAAQHYFSKRPEQLSVGEAAMLAGMVKAPTRLAPTGNLKGARARSKLVVAAMVDGGFLKKNDAARLKPVKLHVPKVRPVPTGTYFADWVMPDARSMAGDPYGVRKVQTTLENRLQNYAKQAIGRAGLGGAQVALVAMRTDGRVVAMVGGKDYAKSPFNRVTQARRQPGSTFKLFVYLAALRSGLTPDDTIQDQPLTVGTWSPKNYGDKYRGTITLRQAFALSSNVAAVRLSERVGRQNVIRAARDLGVRSPLGSEPSVALGTSGMTLLELASAYAGVAANSYPVTPRGLPEVKQSWFNRFWTNKRSMDQRTWSMMLDLLSAAANEGTGRAAALRMPTFGKTGTTQGSRDAIFVGFAGDLVTAVWIGNDDNRPLGNMAGGGVPARIWRDFMVAAVNSAPAGSRPSVEAPPVVVPDEETIDEGAPPPDEQPIDDQGFTVDVGPPPEGPGDEVFDRGGPPDEGLPPPPPPESDGPPPDDEDY